MIFHFQVPIGLYTKSSGEPTEIRDINSINSAQLSNQLLLDSILQFNGERIPERVVHAKGTGAFGYFEVTHDVSQYTYADVFNSIGKKTPVAARFSTSLHSVGGSDVSNEFKGMSIKFYTKEGNLDFTCLSTPVYLYRDPILFQTVVHIFKRNPKTSLFDLTALWDGVTLRPEMLHALFWILADFGIPDGYRKMDSFPIHTFELANKKGKTHYARFNFRTEQGIATLTTAQAAEIQGQDLDYYNRDLYNNIERNNFPAWRLEMHVMTKENIQNIDYDPFDVTRLWKNGTFTTVQIGRLIINRNVDNQFRDVEQSAYNPGHLVPGIPGPVDFLFRGRRLFYRDAQNYRLGRNHNNILVNMPLYAQNYNRDGKPPTGFNGQDAPNYYPNSFNGPIPYVDQSKPKKKLQTLQSNAVDLESCWYFYRYVIDSEAHRQRFINNIAASLVQVTPPVVDRALRLLCLVDTDLCTRVKIVLEIRQAEVVAKRAAEAAKPQPPNTNINNVQNVYKHEDL